MLKRSFCLLLALLTALSVVFTSACGEREFTVRFFANGGTLVSGEEVQIVSNASEIIPPVYEKEGYLLSFDKIIKNIKGDTEVHAVWSPIYYKLTFDGDGGTFYNKTISIALNEKLSNLPVPEKEGYIFVGWTIDETQIFDGYKWTFTQDKVAKANYVIDDGYTYSITYDLAGGKLENPKTYYTFSDDTFTLLEPQKTGYEFTGWIREGETDINKTVVIEKGSTGNLKFTATYSAKSYSISFNANGGTAVSSVLDVTFDQEMGALPTTQKTGYIFLGWFYGETQILSGQKWNVADSVVLEAKWRAEDGQTFSITYDLAGGKLESPKNTYSSIENDFYLQTPTKEGYIFKGYLKDGEEEVVKTVIIRTGTTGNLKFTAVWEREYILRFELSRKVRLRDDAVVYCTVNGNSFYPDIRFTIGQTIVLPVPKVSSVPPKFELDEFGFSYNSTKGAYIYWIIDVKEEELNGTSPDNVGYEIYNGDVITSEIEKYATDGVIIIRPRIRPGWI